MKTLAGFRSKLGVKCKPAKRKMNIWFSFIKEIHAGVEACWRGFDFHVGGNVGGDQGFQQTKIPKILAQNIKRNPRQFLAQSEANSGYKIEIFPSHQILERRSVNAGMKPFMKWTPGM